MKKSIVLLTIVMALIVAPVFAYDVSVTGDIEFGVSNDFATLDEVGTDGKVGFVTDLDDLDLDIKIKDEFTSAFFTIEFDSSVLGDYTIANTDDVDTDIESNVKIYEFEVRTDVFGSLGMDMPVDLYFTTGWHDEIGSKQYEGATVVQMEDDWTDRDPDLAWVNGIFLDLGDLTVQASMHMDFMADADTGLNNSDLVPGGFIGVYGSIGPLAEVEVFYNHTDKLKNSTWGSTVGATTVSKFDLSDSMKLTTSVVAAYDFATSTEANTGDQEDYGIFWYGGSAALAMGDITIGVSTRGNADGNDGSATDYEATLGAAFDVAYKISDIFSVYGAVAIQDFLSDDEMAFTNAAADDEGIDANAGTEIGVKIKAGGTKYALGYRTGNIEVDTNDIKVGEGVFFTCLVNF